MIFTGTNVERFVLEMSIRQKHSESGVLRKEALDAAQWVMIQTLFKVTIWEQVIEDSGDREGRINLIGQVIQTRIENNQC